MNNSYVWMCRNSFTPGQVNRMHTHLANHEALEDVLLPVTRFPGGTLASPSGNIVVESGELDIESPLEMLPGATITVEAGALLRVKSTITGACGQLWGGIVVEGNAMQQQSSNTHGRVVVTDEGLIENATCAIRSKDGGIVLVWGGEFRDNLTGIHFDPYGFMNISNKFFATFTTTDQYAGGDTRPVHLSLSGIRGLNVRNSSFMDERTTCDSPKQKAIGIYSQEAGFRCAGNLFKGLLNGIQADLLTIGNGSLYAGNNTFHNCLNDIRVDLGGGFLISGNEFSKDAPVFCFPDELTGVHISGATQGFTFSDNTFSQEEYAAAYQFIGTDCAGLGSGLGNTITGNIFENLQIGNRASGSNGDEIGGLLYLCNKHLKTAEDTGEWTPKDYEILPGGSIWKTQAGTNFQGILLPTGNEFSGAGYTFYNGNESNPIDYYYDPGVGLQNPDSGQEGAVGIVPIFVNNPPEYCANVQPCNPPCPEEEISIVKSGFFQDRQQRDSLIALLPYITGEEELRQAQETVSFLRLGMSGKAGLVIQHYALDTVEIKTDSILQWLELAETFHSDYHRARHHFFTGNMARFDSLWPALPNRFGLAGESLEEYDDLDEVFSLLRPYVLQDQLKSLTAGALDSLEAHAELCSEPGFLASSILRRNGVSVEPQCGEAEQQYLRQEDRQAAPGAPRIETGEDTRVYPNPSKGELTIEIPLDTEWATARIFNLHGSLVMQQNLAGGRNSLHPALPSGLYIIEIEMSSGERFRRKIILSR